MPNLGGRKAQNGDFLKKSLLIPEKGKPVDIPAQGGWPCASTKSVTKRPFLGRWRVAWAEFSVLVDGVWVHYLVSFGII